MCGLVPFRVQKPKMTATRVIRIKIYDNTFKTSLRIKCSKVISITIKIYSASYIIVVVEFVPLRRGNEFGTRPQNKILVPFRDVLEIFRRAPRLL